MRDFFQFAILGHTQKAVDFEKAFLYVPYIRKLKKIIYKLYPL